MKAAVLAALVLFAVSVPAQTVTPIAFGAHAYTARIASSGVESGDSNTATLAAALECLATKPCVLVTDAVDPAATACRLYEGGVKVGADQPLSSGACRFTLVRVLPAPTNLRVVP